MFKLDISQFSKIMILGVFSFENALYGVLLTAVFLNESPVPGLPNS